MSTVERARENARDNRRDKAKEGRSRRNSASAKVDLRSADWRTLGALITSFAEAGGALRVGYTRDGGALALGCYLGDDYATEYIRPSEDFVGGCIEIAEAWLPESGVAFHQALQEFNR